jgi:uncharacterized protein (TIGR03032 family)
MTQQAALASVHTSNLPELFRQLNCSLLVTTYQAGRVILVRRDARADEADAAGSLNTHFRPFDRPMGVCEKNGRLAIGGANTVWHYRNVPGVAGKLDPPGKHDACYVPCDVHFTGNVDIHEMAWSGDDRLWLVNTRFSCLCTLEEDSSFHPRWRPPFVTAYAPEDRCHLNGLAMRDGKPRYVTALGETDTMGGWRANKADGGVLLDVGSDEVLLRGLSMPHSPRWYRDRLWVLESGKGSLSVFDPHANTLRTVTVLPGFTRGIDFIGPLAFIGLSKVRESASFSGIPIVKELTERICGVWIVNVESAEVLGFLRFEAGVEEIFAVQVLQDARHPEMLMADHPLIGSTYVLPDEALAEVALATPAQLQESPHAWMDRGLEFCRTRDYPQAVAAFRQCLTHQPDFPDARYSLGIALAENGEHAEALGHLRWSCEREPDRSEIHVSLGSLWQRMGEYDAARHAFEAAIARRPDDALAHANLGALLLQLGDIRRGFEEYEWRRKTGPGRRLRSPHPDWDGRAAPGLTLLVDATGVDPRHLILLTRYLPALATRVRGTIVVCPEPYSPLIATVPGVAEIRRPGDLNVAEFDTQADLESLPWLLGTTETSVPPCDAGIDRAALRRRISRGSRPPGSGVINVGLVRPIASADEPSRHRWDNAGLRAWFDTLSNFDAVSVHDVGWSHDGGPSLVELASSVADLDLVLGVDSPAVHLAGVFGKPAWVLLGDVSDWCWPAQAARSPWYPTARMFRGPPQPDQIRWLESVRLALQAWLATCRTQARGEEDRLAGQQ